MKLAMPLITRYVFREFIANWLVVIIALSLMVFGNQFTRSLQRAAEANLPSDVVLKLAFVTFVQTTTIIGPMSLMLAIVLAFGRLGHDGEITAIRATGLSVWRSSAAIGAFALVFSLVLGWLTMQVAPAMAQREQATLSDAFRRAQLAAFEPGRFTQLPGSELIVHVGAADADGTLHRALLTRRTPERIEVVSADRAHYRIDEDASRIVLTAEAGMQIAGQPGGLAARVVHFQTYQVSVPLPEVKRTRFSRDIAPSAELARSSEPEDRAELAWRWSIPVMSMALALLALPLSQLRPRQGRYARVAPALLIFFLYVNLLGAGRSSIARGTLAAWPGLWAVHGLVLLAAAITWFAVYGMKRIRARRRAR
jgi:lipopolysaccharide export system permease protein